MPDQVAILASLMQPVKPAEVSQSTIAERLKPLRAALLKYRRQGYSYAQLAEQLANEKLGIVVAPRTLRNYLQPHRQRPRQRPAAAPAPTSPRTR